MALPRNIYTWLPDIGGKTTFPAGTGQADLTWQAIGGLGYGFKWGEVFAVRRYLDHNFKSGSKIEDVNCNGPALGVAFRW